MNETDIARIADAVCAKMAENHKCVAFTGEERAELHGLAKTAMRVKDYTLSAAIGVLVLGLLTAAWLGIRAAVHN